MAVIASSGHAQTWSVDLDAARSSFGSPPLTAASTNASLSLRYSSGHRTLGAAVAAPLGSEDLFWGVAHGRERLSLGRGRLEAGVDISAMVHIQRDPVTDLQGSGFHGEAMGFGSVSLGALITEVRSGVSRYRGRIGDERWSRNLQQSTLSLSYPVEMAGRRILRMGADLRHLRGDGEVYTWAGGSADLASGPARVWLSAGSWLDGLGDEISSFGVGGGVSVALGERAVLRIQARHEPFDPLFLGTDRTSWGMGLSYRLGSGERVPRAGPQVRASNRVVIRVPLTETGDPPSIAGDFSQWELLPMHRRGGSWEIQLDLPPGLYHYAFRTREGEWFVPEGVEGRRDDGMGGWVARLIVPGDR